MQPVHTCDGTTVTGNAQRLHQLLPTFIDLHTAKEQPPYYTPMTTGLDMRFEGREPSMRTKLTDVSVTEHTHLVNNGLVRCTGQDVLVLIIKREEVPLGDGGVVLTLQLTLCRDTRLVVHLELHHLVARPVDAPLAEAVVATHAVHRRLVRAELDVEDIRVLVGSPAV